MANTRAIATLAIIAVVAADQTVKSIVTRQLGPTSGSSGEYLVVGDWLGLRYGENSGLAFGLMRGQSTLFLATGSVIVVAVMAAWFVTRVVPTRVWVAGALIAGGAIGNVIDRVRFGHVRDFLAVGPWPLFNLADAAITVGVLAAFVAAFRDDVETVGGDEHGVDVELEHEPLMANRRE